MLPLLPTITRFPMDILLSQDWWPLGRAGMKLLPDSIRTRAILVLLFGLTISHLGSTLVYSSDRDQALMAASEQMTADKLATLAELIDTSPQPLRRQVAEAIGGPGLQISWNGDSEAPRVHAEDPSFALIQRSLVAHFRELAHDRLHVAASPVPRPAIAKVLGAAHLLHSLRSEEHTSELQSPK